MSNYTLYIDIPTYLTERNKNLKVYLLRSRETKIQIPSIPETAEGLFEVTTQYKNGIKIEVNEVATQFIIIVQTEDYQDYCANIYINQDKIDWGPFINTEYIPIPFKENEYDLNIDIPEIKKEGEVEIEGLPNEWKLSKGRKTADDRWKLTGGQLENLKIIGNGSGEEPVLLISGKLNKTDKASSYPIKLYNILNVIEEIWMRKEDLLIQKEKINPTLIRVRNMPDEICLSKGIRADSNNWIMMTDDIDNAKIYNFSKTLDKMKVKVEKDHINNGKIITEKNEFIQEFNGKKYAFDSQKCINCANCYNCPILSTIKYRQKSNPFLKFLNTQDVEKELNCILIEVGSN